MNTDSQNVTINGSTHTEMPHTSNIIYGYLYGDVVPRISYYVVLALILFMGTLISIAIVLYEHFGADSQKRTIINRLCSLIFSNIAINSCIWTILRILRDILGLLPTPITTWAFFVYKTISVSTILFATELTIFRFLYIVIWKRMKTINDEFWIRVLAMSTYFISSYVCLGTFLLGHPFTLGDIIDVAHFEWKM